MPIMTKMRDSMPVILIALVILFVVMIVFEWGMDYLGIKSGRHDYVGIIDGKKITYQEFSELVKRAAENQKKQTGQDPEEETMKEIRDQIWNSLIASTLVAKETQRAGITVSDQELVWWFSNTPRAIDVPKPISAPPPAFAISGLASGEIH